MACGLDDRGQAVPAVAVAAVLSVVALLLLGRLGGATADRARARTAADAAALAAVTGDDAQAREMAERNGARLVRVTRVGREVEVVVERGDRRATARATTEGRGGLDPEP